MSDSANAAAPGDPPAEDQRGAPGARRGLAVCIAAICLYWLSLYLYVPVLAPRAHRLGAGVAGVGLVLAAYGFVQFLLRIPTGLWSDRIGRRRPFMLAALVASAVAAVGMGLAHGPVALGLFRAVSGLGACGWVAITLLFAEFFPIERTAWAFGVVGFLSTGSQLVASFAGGMVAQAQGFVAPFFGAAFLACAGFLAMMPVREPRVGVAHGGPNLRERLSVGRQRGVIVASVLSIGSHYVTFVTTYGFTPLVAADRFHAGGAALGVLALCAGVPSAGASLLSGRLAANWSPRRIVAVGFVLAAAGTALLDLAPSLALLDALSAVNGFGFGLLGPSLMTTAVHGFGPDRRGSAMGFYQSIYAIGMFGGPALAGWIGSRMGMGGLFGTTAALAVVGGILAWMLLPRLPWAAAPPPPAPSRAVAVG